MKVLNINLIKKISESRNEPEWLLEFRMKAFEKWLQMKEPHWSEIDYEKIDYDDLNYLNIHSPVDNSDLLETYKKMGLPESEWKALMGMATDTVIDSASVHTSYSDELNRLGIIFLPFSEAAVKYPEMVQKYLATVIPIDDNFYSTLNCAVFSDGTFVYVPKNTKCPIDLASYFRIETANISQFERTLIIADEGSEVTYMEGCSAPRRPNHQLHSGVVEVIALKGATVKYATVQNWADSIYNFVTKRAKVHDDAKAYWTQMEIGSAKTWKYPSSTLVGKNAFSDFYSLTITNGKQQADTGTKMIHLGENSKSNIVSFGVALGTSKQIFRSLVHFGADGCSNASNCDSKIIGDTAIVNTIPNFDTKFSNNQYVHEAKTGALDEAALFYLNLAGINEDEAAALLVAGIASPVLERLPMEFLVESKALIKLAME